MAKEGKIESMLRETMLARYDAEVVEARLKAANQVVQAASKAVGVSAEKLNQMLGTILTTGHAADIGTLAHNACNNCCVEGMESVHS